MGFWASKDSSDNASRFPTFRRFATGLTFIARLRVLVDEYTPTRLRFKTYRELPAMMTRQAAGPG
jgi:hypothetical protein